MNTWLSLLCPSCRPFDLRNWLDSLYDNCMDPKGIELSLTLEGPTGIDSYQFNRWGNIVITYVERGQYSINELTEIVYKQSTCPYIFLSGDDTICETESWDGIFHDQLMKYSDNVVLVYPNDTIFGAQLACYPITSRLVMDSVKWPVPFERYAVDDTIFDIVPYERRIYLEHVTMRHLHLKEHPPGHPVERGGKTWYYPHDVEAMNRDRILYNSLSGERKEIRDRLGAMKMDNKRVLIAVPTAEMTRYGVFYDYLNMLQFPTGTSISFSRGQSPAAGRNVLIQHALDAGFTHIFFVDDDVLVKPDTLSQLMKHDKDIVSALYLMRNHPHNPIIFDQVAPDGRCHTHFLNDSETGLIPIVGCGLGSCLINTNVFRVLEKPWIRLGELDSENWTDDLGFFNRVRKVGFAMYCDLNTVVGHIASVTVWPNRVDNKWVTTYHTGGKESPSVPAAKLEIVNV